MNKKNERDGREEEKEERRRWGRRENKSGFDTISWRSESDIRLIGAKDPAKSGHLLFAALGI